MRLSTKRLRIAGFLVAAGLATTFAGRAFLSMHRPDAILRGPGVTNISRLSQYLPNLKGSVGDSDIYFLEGKLPGGTVLVLGGTHPQETSGVITAILLIENARVAQGRLIVIPQANQSGFTYSEPLGGFPDRFRIGSRVFRFGSRRANPIHRWPDPEVYVHYPSGERLSGDEVRNLNRAFPGKPTGTIMERVAFAIAELIRKEGVDMEVDLHEAYPEYPVINTIVAHEKAMEVATIAQLNLRMLGIKIGLMPSPKKLHGLSHRELGDYTQAQALLTETSNPIMGRLRGITDENLILEGRDVFYERAAKLGRLYVPFDKKGHPLKQRVGRQLAALLEFIRVFSEQDPNRAVQVEGLPTYSDLMKKGLEPFLKPIP